MEYHPSGVSVTAPVSPAIERVKQILFCPFDLGKWFAIGFCAWLAYLGQGGYNYHRSASGKSHSSIDLGPVRTYVHEHLTWIIPLAIGVFVIIVATTVLFLWLRSRGAFMFLHCVVLNRGEVAVPWRKFEREASSLWRFKLVLAMLGAVLVLPIIGAAVWIFVQMYLRSQHFDSSKILLLVVLGVAWLCIGLPLSVAEIFTTHFVAPIMYLRSCTCTDGWRILFLLLSANPARFILYVLFQIVIGFVILLLGIGFVLCTCCVGGLLLIIPYIGSVVRLPVTVFLRSYSLLYLAQYGPEFDVFRAEETPGTDPSPAA